MQSFLRVLLWLLAVTFTSTAFANDTQRVSINKSQTGRLTIEIDGNTVASYVYEDVNIPRPYFAHIRTLDGIQVTRNHPPIAGQDIDDHPHFHPGLWLAFGDISGNDYWRNKAQVKLNQFIKQPSTNLNGFIAELHYQGEEVPQSTICKERFQVEVIPHSHGWILMWSSTFSADGDFYFGDQEEMGLGIRVATPIRADRSPKKDLPIGNGSIVDANHRKNGEQIWGNSSDWCDYSGTIQNRHIGMTIFCHPDNFRPSWFHARDYGLLEANPFGRKAFGKGEISKVTVSPGDSLRLRYGIYIHSTANESKPNLHQEYQNYLRYAQSSDTDQDGR